MILIETEEKYVLNNFTEVTSVYEVRDTTLHHAVVNCIKVKFVMCTILSISIDIEYIAKLWKEEEI